MIVEGILAIRLSKSIDRQPEYAKRIGVSVGTQIQRQVLRANRNDEKKLEKRRKNEKKLYG